jgi:hypothetical protein
MKKLVFVSALFLLFLAFSKIVYAATTCEIADWDENKRNLQVCIGGFSSKEELRKATGEVECISNSQFPNIPGNCKQAQNSSFNLADTPDNMIAQDNDGKYYTCPIFTGINRAIGKLQVKVDSPYSCTTASKITKPKDWDPLTEGLPWQEGTNEPIKEGSEMCPDKESINTAIGCIPVKDTNAFIGFILRWAIGIGGGIAFLLILYSGFMIMSSQGNPERLKAGQELLTSALAGLIMLIFSVFILRIIGVDILGLPGFK